jgi:hypothetical protein
MTVPKTPRRPERDFILQTRLRRAGVLWIVIGLLAAGLAYRTAREDAAADPYGAKRYEYQMEVIGGKSDEFATEVREGFLSLWHGRRLAVTVLVLSFGGAFTCFYVAHRLNFGPPGPSHTGPG